MYQNPGYNQREIELFHESENLLVKASGIIKIKDQEQLAFCTQSIDVIGQMKKQVSDIFDEPIRMAHAAHKTILEKKKAFMRPLDEAERLYKWKVKDYVIEQQRIKAEAERKAQEEEEKKKREAEEVMAKAVELENQGKTKEALDALDEAEKLEETKLAVDIPKGPTMTGVHTRKYWKWRVVDPMKVPRAYLIIDQRAVDEEVRRSKGDTIIPGIEVYEETDIARTGIRR